MLCTFVYLAATAAHNETKTSIDQLRDGIKYLRCSTQGMDELKTCCLEEGVQFVRPTLDVPTRWNSTFLMIKNALRLNFRYKRLFEDYGLTQRSWWVFHQTKNGRISRRFPSFLKGSTERLSTLAAIKLKLLRMSSLGSITI